MRIVRTDHNISNSISDDEELIVVTTRQYLAIADDFLRRLFPELTQHLLPRQGAFTVLIKDDDYVLH